MATVKSRDQLTDVSRPVVDLIERFGFRWDLDTEHPVPDATRRVQIRDERHYTPKAEVTKLAEAMRNGDKFPPVILSADDYLVDGNTRVEAAHRNRYPTIHAFILRDRYEDGSDSVRRRMAALGRAFNLRNGRSLDRRETVMAIRELTADGSYDAVRAAKLLGVPRGTVNGIVAEYAARDRAERLGVHVNGSVPSFALQRLGQAPLNDEPFLALLSLTQDAGLSTKDLGVLLREIKTADNKSDVAAMELISSQREARQEQIAEYRASGKSKPPAAARLRQTLGFVLGHEGNPAALVEANPLLADGHRDTMRRAVAILQRAIEHQAAQRRD